MKKIVSLLIAVMMLFSILSAFSVSAATKSVTFGVGEPEEDDYIYGWGAQIVTESNDTFRKIGDSMTYAVYRFELPKKTVKATISMPVEGPYIVYAAGTIEEDDYEANMDDWVEIRQADDLEVAEDPYLTSRYLAHFEEMDLTPALGQCKRGEIFVIVGLQGGADWCGIWVPELAVKYTHKYINRAWNVENGFSPNGGEDGSRTDVYADYGDERYDGFDGMVVFTTVTDESLPDETDPPETEPKETEPKETEPKETKPAETKPAETKAAETKPAETKAADTKAPADTKAETKPAETKAAEKTGCGSAVASLALFPMFLAAAYVCRRKH